MAKVKKARVKTFLVVSEGGSNKMVHEVQWNGKVIETFEGPAGAKPAKDKCREFNRSIGAV